MNYFQTSLDGVRIGIADCCELYPIYPDKVMNVLCTEQGPLCDLILVSPCKKVILIIEAKRALNKRKKASKQLRGCEELIKLMTSYCRKKREVNVIRIKLFKEIHEKAAWLNAELAQVSPPMRSPYGKSIYLKEGTYCLDDIVRLSL